MSPQAARVPRPDASAEAWSDAQVRARLEALEAELAWASAAPAAFAAPPAMPNIAYWYVRDGTRVYGPMAEPELLDALSQDEFGARCAVARVGQTSWRRAMDVPIFGALLDPDALERPVGAPEMPIPGLDDIRFPAWARVLALCAAAVSGVGLLTPLGAAAAHDHIFANIAGALSVWRLLTFGLVASATMFAPAKMLSRCILAAGSFLGAAWITWIFSSPPSGLFLVDVFVAFALGLAALGFAQAFETRADRVHQQALDFQAALEATGRSSSSRWAWAMLAIVLSGIAVVGVSVGLWLMFAP